MPFGFSSRICAGQMLGMYCVFLSRVVKLIVSLAWADMRLLIASIVKRYTFQMGGLQWILFVIC